MSYDTPDQVDSFIHRLDPRVRVASALVLSIGIAAVQRPWPLAVALACALGLCGAARLPVSRLARRVVPVNLFLLMLFLVLPFSSGGATLFRVGPLSFGAEGLHIATVAALKANALVAMLSALLATMEIVRLGTALEGLGAPWKLSRLLLFTARYLTVIRDEHLRLRTAMRARAFRFAANLHALKATGYLIGMLFVRAFERSERVLAAMKCRGFTGAFHAEELPFPTRLDFAFLAGAALFVVVLAVW